MIRTSGIGHKAVARDASMDIKIAVREEGEGERVYRDFPKNAEAAATRARIDRYTAQCSRALEAISVAEVAG